VVVVPAGCACWLCLLVVPAGCACWLCLLVAPVVLVVLELFHPAGFTATPGMYQYLSQPEPYNPTYKALAYFGPNWWFALHMIRRTQMTKKFSASSRRGK
jgi:hypothetical protein